MEGKSSAELKDPEANFIRYPQIPLKPHTLYTLSAMVKTSGPSVDAWISAKTYDWTPYDAHRLDAYSTPVSHQQRWTPIHLSFKTPSYDPFIDIRFVVKGRGVAWFDDFCFIETDLQAADLSW
jgi:hypothetical protein